MNDEIVRLILATLLTLTLSHTVYADSTDLLQKLDLPNEKGRINSDHIIMGYAFGTLSNKVMTTEESFMWIIGLSVLKESTDNSGFDSGDIISNVLGWGLGTLVIRVEF